MKASYASLIAERVRYYRNYLRLPQTFVADVLEVDRTSYSRMESGKPELSASDLKILANLFHVSIENFFEPLRVQTANFKDNVQYRLDKDNDFRLPDQEGFNAIGDASNDLLIWARDLDRHEKELRDRQKKSVKSYEKFKTINEALSHCSQLIEDNKNGNSLDIYRLIVGEFGCWMSWNSFGAFSGMYLEKDKEITKNESLPLPIIGINSSHSPERQRFSAAHELAHHLLGRKGKYGSPTKYVSDPDEKEANQFAAELLMNKESVLKIMSELKRFSSNKIEESHLIFLTAGQLQVSFSALVNRLITIGEISYEKREEYQNIKVSDLQKATAKETKIHNFPEELIFECEKKLTKTNFYRIDETFDGPRGVNDLRFLQDYSYVEYLKECKANTPLEATVIFEKVVSYISHKYPRYRLQTQN